MDVWFFQPIRFKDSLDSHEVQAIFGVEDEDWIAYEEDTDYWVLRLLVTTWFGGSSIPMIRNGKGK